MGEKKTERDLGVVSVYIKINTLNYTIYLLDPNDMSNGVSLAKRQQLNVSSWKTQL